MARGHGQANYALAPRRGLKYHHAMPLELCRYGEIEGNEEFSRQEDPNEWYLPAYRWLEERIGHWPLFLAVGSSETDMRMTGYQNNWRRLLAQGKDWSEYRKPGQFPSIVLFSFSSLPGVSYSDYNNWHGPLNEPSDDPQIERDVLAPGRSEANWLRKAARQPGSVQGHVQSLDLRRAERVCCRNQKTRKQLIDMGFLPERVIVDRLKVEDY